MRSPEPEAPESRARTLLALAQACVEFGVRAGRPLRIDPEDYPPELREPRASFVTLRVAGALRGCTGSLEAHHPLVVDVAHSAYRAAFGDPRFRPVEAHELSGLAYHLSLLERPEPLPVASEAELVTRLRPGVDGLVLYEGGARATFLPAVWRSLPAPREFLRELRRKAGLAPDHWSDTLRFERYRVEEIS